MGRSGKMAAQERKNWPQVHAWWVQEAKKGQEETREVYRRTGHRCWQIGNIRLQRKTGGEQRGRRKTSQSRTPGSNFWSKSSAEGAEECKQGEEERRKEAILSNFLSDLRRSPVLDNVCCWVGNAAYL